MRRGQPKKVLPVGKLPLEHLRSLLRHLPKHDPRLLIGPQIGEDAAAIDAGDRYLVVTTDPRFGNDRRAMRTSTTQISHPDGRIAQNAAIMAISRSRKGRESQ